jgi:outer membrane protein insertion porin family
MDESDASAPIATHEEAARPQELGYIVREIDIRFAGPKTTTESVILANIRTKVGEPFTQSQSDEDVRSLYATGLFSNVRIFQEPAEDGLKVVVLVQGISKLKDVVFEGNTRFKAERLRKETNLKSGDSLSERQIAEGANNIVEFYQKSGYHDVKVEFETSPDELTGQTIVKYVVSEGTRTKIQQVNFEGNKAFEDKILRKKVETRKYAWYSSWLTKKGFLRETELEEDRDRLVGFYRSEGYIDADVKDVKVEHPSREEAVVNFLVFEGTQYKVGKLSITGNEVFSNEQILKVLSLKPGSTFIPRGLPREKPKGLEKDIKEVQDLYGAKGYIDTNVKVNRIPNVETGTMDLEYEIREGEMAYIDLIEIRGNKETKDKVIRRELAVAPGEIYNTVKVDASKKRLENLGYFSNVTAIPEDTGVSNRKNLIVGVEEQRTGSISFGAGFSSVDSILGFAEITQGNFDIAKPPYFRGAGQKARIRAQLGARRQDYIISFTEPWFMNKQLSVGFDLFYNEASFLSSLYNERHYGVALRASRAVGEFNKLDAVYKFEQIELFDVDNTAPTSILSESGSRSRSALGLTFTRDTRDSFMLPSKGYKAELWGEMVGGPVFGGETDIFKLGFNGQLYFTMPWWEKNILSFNGSTAVVDEWADGSRVPIFDRFFLGGPNSVRGFKFREVGPKDPSGGEPIGGGTMAYLQTEYSIPVIDRVRFASWVDTGQVWKGAFDWSSTPLDVGAGIGLRLNLPIGPINIDYGWPLHHDEFTDAGGQFSFNVGTKF